MATKIKYAQVDSTEFASKGDVSAALSVGSEIIWTADLADIPSGFLECDGSAVSRATYSVLWGLYSEGGTVAGKHGNGDGSTTFNLPNRQGLSVRHPGSQSINGRTKTGPSDAYSKLEDQLQGHWHESKHRANSTGTSGGDNAAVNIEAATQTLTTTIRNPVTDAANGTPRTGAETRVASAGGYYIVRVG